MTIEDLFHEWIESGAPSLYVIPAAVGVYWLMRYNAAVEVGRVGFLLPADEVETFRASLRLVYRETEVRNIWAGLAHFYEFLIETRHVSENPFK